MSSKSSGPVRRWCRAAAVALTGTALVTAGLAAGAAPSALALGGASAGVAITASSDGNGYAVISAVGGRYDYGDSAFTGSLAGTRLNAPIVDAASQPGSNATWMVGADGGVFTYGGAQFRGSMGGKPLNQPVTAIVPSASGDGYVLVARDGGVFAFGDFAFPGSMAGNRLNAPVVDAARPAGAGLWEVAADGGVFALGGAPFYGSMGGKPLNAPITAIVPSPTGRGYLLVAADGGTFAFGDFPFPGSLAGIPLNTPVVDAVYAAGGGVWLVAADGGVFTLNAPFYGAATGESNPPPPTPVGTPAKGGNGGNTVVSCPRGGSITIAAAIGPKVAQLLTDANKGGLALCGSGWRDPQEQVALRRKNCGTPATPDTIYKKPSGKCNPPTAIPGTSMHERGLAIDFTNCAGGSACFKWLSANASRYGLANLPSESWHWSTTGH